MQARFRKVIRFLGSMRFAIALLAVLALACAAGSMITQGQSYTWYAQRYGERTAAFIVALQLDDAFHSPWFIAISSFLCLDLLLCNILKVKALARRTRLFPTPDSMLRVAPACSVLVREPETAFKRLGMPAPSVQNEDGRNILFASKGRAGLWGAWICHLGILLLILGFSLGEMLQKEYAVYGVPGQTRQIGSTGLYLTIDDFRIDLGAEGNVSQYTTDFTVMDTEGPEPAKTQSAAVSVNHPARLFGMKYYQNSTGWAAKANVSKNGEAIQSQWLCAGEYLSVADKPDLTVFLSALYPDYAFVPGVGPYTLSDTPANPAYLYAVYYNGQLLGMNVLLQAETLTIDEYAVTFSDPAPYTLLQIKRNSFALFALLGGSIVTAGLALALYVQPTRIWASRVQEGVWHLYGENRKGGKLFSEAFERAAKAAQIVYPEDEITDAES